MKLKAKKSRKNSKSDMIDKEIQQYLAIESIDLKTEPLVWWVKQGKHFLPMLFIQAEKNLICQATR